MTEHVEPGDPKGYWEQAAATHSFTHPLRPGLFAHHAARVAPTEELRALEALDIGCGQGRLTAELAQLGWRAVGADRARAMVDAARAAHPELELHHVARWPGPWEAGRFGLCLLVSVLTCVPGDTELEALVAEVRRSLAPGGLVYFSDLLLQADVRNHARYDAGELRFGVRGVFQLEGGPVVRHFARERLGELFAGFELLVEEEIEVRTMRGNPATALQVLMHLR